MSDTANNSAFRKETLPTPQNDTLTSSDGKFMLVDAMLPDSGHWLWCQPKPEHDHSSPNTGWKLHISATSRDMQEALAALAMDHNLAMFKFSPAGILESDQQPEAGSSKGKTAVFYHSQNGIDGNPINWEGFIKEAAAIVHAFGGPGLPVAGDRHVPGSPGIYYSADTREAGGAYVPSAMRKSYNLGRNDDPFAAVDLRNEVERSTDKDKTAPLPLSSRETQRSTTPTSGTLRS